MDQIGSKDQDRWNKEQPMLFFEGKVSLCIIHIEVEEWCYCKNTYDPKVKQAECIIDIACPITDIKHHENRKGECNACQTVSTNRFFCFGVEDDQGQEKSQSGNDQK